MDNKITPKVAAVMVLGDNPGFAIASCFKAKNSYIFTLVPENIKNVKGYMSGSTLPAVEISTGRMFDYDILENTASYKNRTEIPLKSLI